MATPTDPTGISRRRVGAASPRLNSSTAIRRATAAPHRLPPRPRTPTLPVYPPEQPRGTETWLVCLLVAAMLVLACLLGVIGSILHNHAARKAREPEALVAAAAQPPSATPVRTAPPPAPQAAGGTNRPGTPREPVPARPRAPVPETDAELEAQLLRVPELALSGVDELRGQQIAYAKERGVGPARDAVRDFAQEAAIAKGVAQVLREGVDAGLPVRLGSACTLGPRAAEALGRGAVDLRWTNRTVAQSGAETFMTALVSRTANGQVAILDKRTGKAATTFAGLPRFTLRPVNNLRKLFETTWPAERVEQTFDVVPVLTQVLQVEDAPYRRLLVDELDRLPGRAAGEALARRALYDTSSGLRGEAIEALRRRPAAEFRNVLLDGFRYPWAPAARHAAEALVRTRDVGAVPRLAKLLDEADPALPYRNDQTHRREIHEVVRLNHLRNCCLCHAPSYSSGDWIPGRIMDPSVPIPAEYYGSPSGAFVRADVTYLRQDFSTMQPVENPQPWPRMQRYDYFVRTRTPTADEVARADRQPAHANFPQREAVLLALRGLTGRDLGAASAPWQRYAEEVPTRPAP